MHRVALLARGVLRNVAVHLALCAALSFAEGLERFLQPRHISTSDQHKLREPVFDIVSAKCPLVHIGAESQDDLLTSIDRAQLQINKSTYQIEARNQLARTYQIQHN